MKNKLKKILSAKVPEATLPHTELFPAYYMKLLGVWFLMPFFDAMPITSKFFMFLKQALPEWGWGLLLLLIAEVQIQLVAHEMLLPRKWIALLSFAFLTWFFLMALAENWRTVLVPTFAMAAYFQGRSIYLLNREIRKQKADKPSSFAPVIQ
ncbi:MAG: hypothetical protein V4671_08390 [Armatimonadota bacterium]